MSRCTQCGVNESTVVLLRTYLDLYSMSNSRKTKQNLPVLQDGMFYRSMDIHRTARRQVCTRSVGIPCRRRRHPPPNCLEWIGFQSGRKDGWMDDEKDGTVNARDG
mmetsp:Transcript_21974/g.61128  ORF Transcript_21974/g.61128 Transcript_21974/m.61128 type:complete len:106 (-) Transcript_21974:1347-1664(-)